MYLLNQLCPKACSLDPLNIEGATKRAEKVIQMAEKIGSRNYITARAICTGNPRLNIAFVAHLFNKYPGLTLLDDTEKASIEDQLFKSQGSREARGTCNT